MGVEETMWEPLSITSCLAERFGIHGAVVVGMLHGGISNCYLVESERGRLVFKEFPSWYPKEDILREPGLCTFLADRAIPVATFVPTFDGSYHVERKGRVSTLQSYVEGTVYEPNKGPKGVVQECAMNLGRLHRELLDYPRLPDGMGRDWFYGWDPEATIAHYEGFLRDNLQAYPEGIRDVVHDDITSKIGMIRRLPPIDMEFEALTRLNTHGDYKIQNMVFNGDRLLAIIDISGCVHPVVWEVIRSYAHADPDCADGNLEIDGLVGYCAAYLSGNPTGLSGYDLRCLTDYWLVQLLRANYHGEYLSSTPGPAREEALRFASWSTRVCRWLLDNRDVAMEALVTLGV